MAKVIKNKCPKCDNLKDIRAKSCFECYIKRINFDNIKEKICTRCNKLFPISSFRIRKRFTKGGERHVARSWCKKCESNDCINRSKLNKIKDNIPLDEKKRLLRKVKSILKTRMRMMGANENDLDNFVNIYLSQTECPICLTPVDKLNKMLSIDHCHTEMKLRGFLCSNCNSGIGQLKDSIDNLQRALEYLTKPPLYRIF